MVSADVINIDNGYLPISDDELKQSVIDYVENNSDNFKQKQEFVRRFGFEIFKIENELLNHLFFAMLYLSLYIAVMWLSSDVTPNSVFIFVIFCVVWLSVNFELTLHYVFCQSSRILKRGKVGIFFIVKFMIAASILAFCIFFIIKRGIHDVSIGLWIPCCWFVQIYIFTELQTTTIMRPFHQIKEYFIHRIEYNNHVKMIKRYIMANKYEELKTLLLSTSFPPRSVWTFDSKFASLIESMLSQVIINKELNGIIGQHKSNVFQLGDTADVSIPASRYGASETVLYRGIIETQYVDDNFSIKFNEEISSSLFLHLLDSVKINTLIPADFDPKREFYQIPRKISEYVDENLMILA